MIVIHEPATLITDYLLAAFTIALAWRLRAQSRLTRSAAQWWWAVAFAATAVAGIAGGSVHGFPDALGRATAGVWLVAMESLVVASLAVVRAAISASRLGEASQRRADALAVVAYGAYGGWLAWSPSFVFAIVAYGSALAVLMLLHRTQWLVAGVVVSIVAAAVQQGKWSLHPSFNHNDLYHVIQAVAVWMLYLGAMAHDARSGG